MPSAVDLTGDSSDDGKTHRRSRKNKRASHRPSSDVWLLQDTADSAVAAGDQRKRSRVSLAGAISHRGDGSRPGKQANIGDDEVLVVAEVGQVATRDMAHVRLDCAVNTFTYGTHVSNGKHCKQCYCYVCDVKASECQFWGTGARPEDHANARPLTEWNKLRRAVREGNKALVRDSFNGGSGNAYWKPPPASAPQAAQAPHAIPKPTSRPPEKPPKPASDKVRDNFNAGGSNTRPKPHPPPAAAVLQVPPRPSHVAARPQPDQQQPAYLKSATRPKEKPLEKASSRPLHVSDRLPLKPPARAVELTASVGALKQLLKEKRRK